MILVPVWVERDDEKGILAVLGSEPRIDAQPEFIPRNAIRNCVYGELTSAQNNRKMALLLLDPNDLPETIQRILEGK
jgi:hypothetical protein